VKLTSVGDVLHAFPAVSAIRRRFPDAHLAWLVDYRGADVVAMSPDVDEAIALGARRAEGAFGRPTFAEHWQALRQVRAGRFDVVVDMQGLLKSGAFTYLSGARVRIGFGDARIGNRWATNVKLPSLEPGLHAADAYCEFARLLGAQPNRDEFRIRVPEADVRAAEQFLARARVPADAALAGIVPGSAWPSKRWPPEHFAELAAWLAEEQGMRIAVLGHRDDAEAADLIAARCAESAVSLAGETTLGQAIGVAWRCRLVVGGDTGLIQVAAALDVPTVAIYGPTDPALTGPIGPRVRVVQSKVDCWPCRERRCEHWECMRELRPETVCEAAAELLDVRMGASS
jgi:heptosyltransferase-1